MKKLLLFLLFVPLVVFAGVIGKTATPTEALWERYDGYTYAILVNLPESGTVTKLSAYLQSTAGTINGQMFLFLPNGTNSTASTLISSSSVTGITTTAGWFDFAIETPPTLSAGNYWIGFAMESIGVSMGYYYDASSTTRTDYLTATYYDNPVDYIYGNYYGGMSIALQATYTVGGSTATTPYHKTQVYILGDQ
jgi:hypothetical protein